MVACAQIELRETQFLMADKARVSLETAFTDLLQAHAEIAELTRERDELRDLVSRATGFEWLDGVVIAYRCAEAKEGWTVEVSSPMEFISEQYSTQELALGAAKKYLGPSVAGQPVAEP